MTPDQLPAGLPMDDKIEAWVQRAMVLSRHCQDAWGRIDFGEQDNDEAERAELEAHLRTTPEGFVLVKAEPVAWLVHYTTHGQPRSQVQQHNAVGDIRALFDPKATVTELYAAPMLAASQESAALKEQSKC